MIGIGAIFAVALAAELLALYPGRPPRRTAVDAGTSWRRRCSRSG